MDANRFDVVTWQNSSGSTVSNFVATGGSTVCTGEIYEFFGEARGDTSEEPRFIVAGTEASWTDKKPGLIGKTKTKPQACSGTPLAGTVASTYTVSGSAKQINLLKVSRVFTFNNSGSGANANLRAFMPRLPDSIYDTVLVPNASNAIQTYSASSCGGTCQPSSWNGKWLADDDGSGNGVMIIRSPTSSRPAQVDIDSDGSSNSDVSAIALTPPSGGWSGKVTETEYLCFYDPASWTAADRSNGKYPTGCTVPGL